MKVRLFTALFPVIVSWGFVLFGGCSHDKGRTVVPHEFTFDRADMPVPEKPDFLVGDIRALELQMRGGYPEFTYIGKCKGATIFYRQSFEFGRDHSIYDEHGFLTFRRYGGCLQTITDSIYYVYDKTASILYQIVRRHDSGKEDSVYLNGETDTCYYFFNSGGKLNYKLEKYREKGRIILTTYGYNKTGSIRGEYTRQYNEHLLELPDTVGSKEVNYYYSKGRKDSVVTMEIWPGETVYKIKTKQTYDAAGNPGSVYTDDRFHYRYRIINGEEYRRRTKGKSVYVFDEKGGVWESEPLK